MGFVGILLMMVGGLLAGCGMVEPHARQNVADLQLTVDTLTTSVRDAQQTVAELRAELESRRQELADSQIARAQLDGRIREAERRLTEARHIIDLQREELAASRAERQYASRMGTALHSQLQQLQKQLSKRGMPAQGGREAGSFPANGFSSRGPVPGVIPAKIESGAGQQEIAPLPMPPPVTASGSAATLTDEARLSKGSAHRRVVVEAGDTLWRIAHRFHVTMRELMVLNKLTDEKIFIGQALVLPDRPAAMAPQRGQSE